MRHTEMRRKAFKLLLLTLFAALTSLTVRAQNKATVLVLVHANLIDGASPEASHDATIFVRGTQIESVGTKAVALPAGAEIVDIRGRWLLPGYVDAHAHISTMASARRALQYGTTTVRVLGVNNFADVGLRELHNAGATDLPAIVAAGYQTRPDVAQAFPGFLLDFPNMKEFGTGLRGADSLRKVVRALAERHVDLIKILATERAGTPETDPRKRTFTDEEMAAIVDEAHKAGLPVAAHAHGDEGARGAVLAGVRSIEHGTYLSDDTLALMKSRGTYLDPTISVWDEGTRSENPILQQRARAMLPRARDTAGRAWKMGIKIVAGTDAGYGETGLGRNVADEVAELVRASMPPMEAIKAGTSVSAECLGVGKRTGTIKPGMTADFIAVDRDPVTDIAALQDLVLVIHDGKVILNRLNP
jgi:imidazolonepropionase-like amidohydrolase